LKTKSKSVRERGHHNSPFSIHHSQFHRRFLIILLLLLLLCVSVTAGMLVNDWLIDRQNTQDTDRLREMVGAPSLPSFSPEDITPPLMDFTAINEVNNEINAWLILDDTDINYPIVQAPDNDYYLTRTAERKKNANGALFLDFRVHADFSDFNNVIYGHNMKSGKMFGTLVKFKEKEFWDSHATGTLYTPGKTYGLELFAVAITSHISAYYGYAFVSPSEREAHLQMIKNTAKYYRDVGITEKDRILALSTCSYEYKNARTLVLFKIVN
jgi:sortase B